MRLIRHIRLIGLIGLICLIGLIAGAKTASASTISKPSNNLGLVGYWSMEDGVGSKATDFSGNANTGTLTNMEAADWTTGKVGKGLDLGGTNESVKATSATSTNFSGNVELTMASWFKLSSMPSDSSLFGKWGGQAGYMVYVSGTNNCKFYVDAAPNNPAVTCFSADNAWHHYVVTKSGTTITPYIDGVAASTAALSSGTITTNTTPFEIGSYADGGGAFIVGLIDEVRIYNRALSAAEVLTLYGQTRIAHPKNNTNVGLIGYWPLNEGTGSVVTDMSGQGNNGSLVGATSWVNGMVGKALTFDGNNDYVSIAANGSINNIETQGGGGMSMSAWIYNRTAGACCTRIVAKGTNWTWRMQGDANFMFSKSFAGGLMRCYPNIGMSTNTWYHVAMTWNGGYLCSGVKFYINGGATAVTESVDSSGAADSDASDALHISTTSDSAWDGYIDEVRIYKRILTAAEIAKIYAQTTTTVRQKANVSTAGAPGTSNLVGWWTFDGNKLTTTTSTDSSASLYHGALSGASGSQNKPQPTIGKVGQALNFDGTDDFVNVNVAATSIATGSFTIAAWIKMPAAHTSASAAKPIFIDADSPSLNDVYFCLEGTGGFCNGSPEGALCLVSYNSGFTSACSSQTTWAANTWYHVVGTMNTSSGGKTVYINGVSAGTNSTTARGGTPYSVTAKIGAQTNAGTSYFPGAIDDVRVYNKALSAAEVLQLYNLGK